jgi:hypothetical protein
MRDQQHALPTISAIAPLLIQSLQDFDAAAAFVPFFANTTEIEAVLQCRLSVPDRSAPQEPHPMEAQIQQWRDVVQAQMVSLQLITNMVYVEESEDDDDEDQPPNIAPELVAALPVAKVCRTLSFALSSTSKLIRIVHVDLFVVCDSRSRGASSCVIPGFSRWRAEFVGCSSELCLDMFGQSTGGSTQ